MLFGISRALQFAGLVILPGAVFLEISEVIDLRGSLAMAGAGVCVFAIGYVLQGLSGK